MTAASNQDGATGLFRRPECAGRKVDGIRIFALMKAGVQAHHWSRMLFLYMGLLVASVKGKSPSLELKTCKMQQAYPHPPPPPTLSQSLTECKSVSATRRHTLILKAHLGSGSLRCCSSTSQSYYRWLVGWLFS